MESAVCLFYFIKQWILLVGSRLRIHEENIRMRQRWGANKILRGEREELWHILHYKGIELKL